MLTYLTTKGLSDAQIQLISGHESKESLEVYQHLSLESVDKAYQDAVQSVGIYLKRFLWDFTYLCWAPMKPTLSSPLMHFCDSFLAYHRFRVRQRHVERAHSCQTQNRGTLSSALRTKSLAQDLRGLLTRKSSPGPPFFWNVSRPKREG